MSVLQTFALAALVLTGPAVVLTRDPLRQAFVVGAFGFELALLFMVFQAPDVSLSEIVVCTVALPIMILLALAKIAQREAQGGGEEGEPR